MFWYDCNKLTCQSCRFCQPIKIKLYALNVNENKFADQKCFSYEEAAIEIAYIYTEMSSLCVYTDVSVWGHGTVTLSACSRIHQTSCWPGMLVASLREWQNYFYKEWLLCSTSTITDALMWMSYCEVVLFCPWKTF